MRKRELVRLAGKKERHSQYSRCSSGRRNRSSSGLLSSLNFHYLLYNSSLAGCELYKETEVDTRGETCLHRACKCTSGSMFLCVGNFADQLKSLHLTNMNEDCCRSQSDSSCETTFATTSTNTVTDTRGDDSNRLCPSYSAMISMKKEWPNHEDVQHFHHNSEDTCSESLSHQCEMCDVESGKQCSPSVVHQLDCCSGSGSVRSNSHYITTSVQSNNGSSTPFREIIELLVINHLESGGTGQWEEFRNLVEVLLNPIFESLPGVSGSRRNSINGMSSPFMSTPSCSSAATQTPETGSLATPETPCIGDGSNSTTFSGKSEGSSENLRDSEAVEVGQTGDSLSCPVCYGVLIDPVTVSCGHSYCKKCLQKESSGNECRRCRYSISSESTSQYKTNVLIGSLVEKWWAKEIEATRLRSEGNSLFEGKKVEQALQKYSLALNLAPDDHLSLGNRSHALLTAGRSEEALQDAEAATKHCPMWPKGYFRKSAALISLGRYEDAFLSLTICMYLMKAVSPLVPSDSPKEDPAQTQVVNEIIKILQKLFLQSTAAVGSTLKRHSRGEQLQFTPYPSGQGRLNRRRAATARKRDWNDFGYSSSGDEGEQFPSSTIWCWKSTSTRNQHHSSRHLNHSSCNKSNGYCTFPVIEHLSVRLNKLFGRASQDLKSLEGRLRKMQLRVAPRNVSSEVISGNDMECSLCYRLLFQPVSTSCGHTFCKSCLDRCLDHNPCCPLCKTSLQNYLATRDHPAAEFLECALKQYFFKELEERIDQHMEELNARVKDNLDADIPIFVCTMAFPTVPCPLHVFEPRYRLMIRRCMENGSNRFGMCCYIADNENNYGEIGTLLEIKNIQYFADGRSVVDTVGCRRFKVIRKTIVDGYNAARIELLQDLPIESSKIEAVEELHDKVFREATEWLQSIGQVRRQRIHSHFGQMPSPEDNWLSSSDGPSWTWWLLAILPLDSKAQLSILTMCSLQKRLECILKVLVFVKSRMDTIGE